MTEAQKTAIRLLSRCTFLPASYDKRFARNMGYALQAQEAEPNNSLPLTGKQDEYLFALVHKYRRQHGRCTCLLCLKPTGNPYQAELFEEGKTR